MPSNVHAQILQSLMDHCGSDAWLYNYVYTQHKWYDESCMAIYRFAQNTKTKITSDQLDSHAQWAQVGETC